MPPKKGSKLMPTRAVEQEFCPGLQSRVTRSKSRQIDEQRQAARVMDAFYKVTMKGEGSFVPCRKPLGTFYMVVEVEDDDENTLYACTCQDNANRRKFRLAHNGFSCKHIESHLGTEGHQKWVEELTAQIAPEKVKRINEELQ